jgi:hypothetical protein
VPCLTEGHSWPFTGIGEGRKAGREALLNVTRLICVGQVSTA